MWRDRILYLLLLFCPTGTTLGKDLLYSQNEVVSKATLFQFRLVICIFVCIVFLQLTNLALYCLFFIDKSVTILRQASQYSPSVPVRLHASYCDKYSHSTTSKFIILRHMLHYDTNVIFYSNNSPQSDASVTLPSLTIRRRVTQVSQYQVSHYQVSYYYDSTRLGR